MPIMQLIGGKMRPAMRGVNLVPDDRQHVLAAYVHRFTREHKPCWSNAPWKDGKPYPVQFRSDKEWLENTWFAVTKSARLDKRVRGCYSRPTWPDNPELRKRFAILGTSADD